MEPYYKESTVTARCESSAQGSYWTYPTDPVQINASQAVPLTPKKVNSISGFRQANWKSLIKQGTGATTICDGVKWSADLPTNKFKSNVLQRNKFSDFATRGLSCVSRFQFTSWPFVNIPTAPSDVQARVRNRVIAKFISKCSEARSVIEAGQDLGEYRQTLDSIQQPLRSMRHNLYGYLYKLDVLKHSVKKVNLPRALADSYLELHFGVAPLVDDVANIVGKCGSFHPSVQRVSARSHEAFAGADGREDISGHFTPGDNNLAYAPFMGFLENSEYQMQYKGAIRTGVRSDGTISRVQELQLLPRNWLPTIWDLLPYSWIADYFANIGEIVSSLSFVYSDLLWGNLTARTSIKRVYSGMSYANKDGAYPEDIFWATEKNEIAMSSESTTFEAHAFHREPLNPSDLLATFELKVPTSKWAFANMGALLIQRASKIVPFL